jgi:chaperonin GroEL
MIAQAMQKVGNEGVITVEEAKTAETELDVVEGMQFDRGYLSPYFITNADKMVAELEDPYILLHEKKLSSLQAMLPMLEAVVQTSKPLLIIAEDIEGEALATLVVNKLRGGLKVAPSRPRASVTAARPCWKTSPSSRAAVISEDLGIKLENVTLDMLGRAKRVRIEKENSTIVDGAGKKADISPVAPRSRRRSRKPPRTTTRRSSGASGQAGWRRCRHQGRRRHGSRSEGTQGPRGRRAERHPRCR